MYQRMSPRRIHLLPALGLPGERVVAARELVRRGRRGAIGLAVRIRSARCCHQRQLGKAHLLSVRQLLHERPEIFGGKCGLHGDSPRLGVPYAAGNSPIDFGMSLAERLAPGDVSSRDASEAGWTSVGHEAHPFSSGQRAPQHVVEEHGAACHTTSTYKRQ